MLALIVPYVGIASYRLVNNILKSKALYRQHMPAGVGVGTISPTQTPTPQLYSIKHQVAHNCDFADSSLTSKGVYHRVRRVLDTSEWYYLAGEYHSCGQCSGTFISYDWRQLRQLPDGRRGLFPAVLTHKVACDRRSSCGCEEGRSATARRRAVTAPPRSTTRRGQLCLSPRCPLVYTPATLLCCVARQ